MDKWVSYYRVSTQKQGRSGLGLEAQQAAVKGYLNGGNWKLIAEFTEIESGKVNDRPQLKAALARCKLTGARLIISKLDRLSRDAAFLFNLEEAGVEFVCADMPHANRLTVRLMAVLAEEERRMISQRTKDALAAAKARGIKLGGTHDKHKVDPALGRAALAERADEFAQRVLPVIRPLRDTGASLRTIAASLTEQGIKTSRGGAWTAAAVNAVLARAA
ncbi:recombinase family protein [Acidisoma sp. C75]